MKQNEILSNIRLNGDKIVFNDDDLIDEMGDNHVSTSVDTPMVANAFEKSDTRKSPSFRSILKPSWKPLDWI